MHNHVLQLLAKHGTLTGLSCVQNSMGISNPAKVINILDHPLSNQWCIYAQARMHACFTYPAHYSPGMQWIHVEKVDSNLFRKELRL